MTKDARELLTAKALNAVVRAEEEFGERACAEDLFVLLLEDQSNIAAMTMRRFKINMPDFRALAGNAKTNILENSSVETILERALEVAARMEHNYIGVEHILMVLLDDLRVQHALEELGIESKRVRRELLRLLGQSEK